MITNCWTHQKICWLSRIFMKKERGREFHLSWPSHSLGLVAKTRHRVALHDRIHRHVRNNNNMHASVMAVVTRARHRPPASLEFPPSDAASNGRRIIQRAAKKIIWSDVACPWAVEQLALPSSLATSLLYNRPRLPPRKISGLSPFPPSPIRTPRGRKDIYKI